MKMKSKENLNILCIMQLITPFQIDLNMTPYFSRIITIFRLYVQFYSRKVLIFIRQSLAIHVLEYIR